MITVLSIFHRYFVLIIKGKYRFIDNRKYAGVDRQIMLRDSVTFR
jgi:hypothetical protein